MGARRRQPKRELHLDNLDAVTTAFFARELEYISQEMFRREYPEKKARLLIPVSHEIPAGTETYTFRQWDRVGIAEIASDYSSKIPMADAFGEEFTSKIRQMLIGYQFSTKEIRSAKLMNRPLDAMRADAAREGFEQLVDNIATNGDAANGLVGFLNQSNVPLYTIPNGASNSPLWTLKEPAEILADMNGVSDSIFTSTNEVEIPDTMLLPTAQYRLVNSTPRSSNSDKTILEYFLENNGHIKEVAPWTRLKGAGSGGKDRGVCYRRDPSKLRLQIPMEQTPLPPQPRDARVVINTEGEIGGVIVYKPMSMAYFDNF